MKRHKILTIITIAVLLLLLTGCGATLEDKIEEVQAKNTITTADVVKLLELEGLEVKQQKPGAAINEKWKNVAIYKVEGENLLILTQFGGKPWERNNKLRELELNDRWAWFGDGAYAVEENSVESIKRVTEELKLETGYYSASRIYSYKNVIAVYVSHMPIDDAKNMTKDEMLALHEKIEENQQISSRVQRLFWQDLCGMKIAKHTTVGNHVDATLHMRFYEQPYNHKERIMYEYFEKSDIFIELHEDIAEQYSEESIKIECRGPLAGPIAKDGSRGLTIDEIYNSRSFTLGASRENIGYGKEPYTGPIQYEVIVTIGDEITETLIVGSEGTETE